LLKIAIHLYANLIEKELNVKGGIKNPLKFLRLRGLNKKTK